MAQIDLNADFDYKIQSPYPTTKYEIQTIIDNPPMTKEDWGKGVYSAYKTNLKKDHLIKQNDRCAYCRNYVEPDGYYEPIEHVVAKSIKPKWMLNELNLIVTCDPCNNLKNDDQTLTNLHVDDANFPNSSDAFLIFNPHFDKWSDHFLIEDEIFLVAKPKSKGTDTIRICRLYRYSIPINNAIQLRMNHGHSYKVVAHRLYNISDKTSQEFTQLKLSLAYFEIRKDII